MKAISYPFKIDTFGRLTSTEDVSKIYLDKLYTLLSTMVGSRPMRPDYGLDIRRALYENGNDEKAAILYAINQAVRKWLPMLKIEQIDVTDTSINGESTVSVQVNLPDSTTGTVAVSTSKIMSTGAN